MTYFHATPLILMTFFLAALSVAPAHACACCAERGARFDGTQPLADYTRGVVDAVRFDLTASLYQTAADWSEQVRGIRNPAHAYTYSLDVQKGKRSWTFAFTDAAGHSGRLSFTFAPRVKMLHVDPQPEKQKSGMSTNVTLYKEWRLDGTVNGTGIFSLGARGAPTASLILHGRGNGCTDFSQFTNWTLDVRGKVVQFRFFGRLDH